VSNHVGSTARVRACLALSCHKFRPRFISALFSVIVLSLPLRQLRLVSFHFTSFYPISFRLVSFHFIPHARARLSRALRRADARGKRDLLSFPYLFFSGAFIRFRPQKQSGTIPATKEEDASAFIPVVNNIFITASSKEERGKKTGAKVRKCNFGGGGNVCRSCARRRGCKLLQGITRTFSSGCVLHPREISIRAYDTRI